MKLKPKLPKAISEAERRYWVCMAHDTRTTTTFVVCGTCKKKSEYKEQLTWTQEAITDEEARELFTKRGWHVGRGRSRNTTRCPKHNKGRRMFKEVAGDHCERCLAPVQKDFHANLCRFYHGTEYLCPTCTEYIDANVPRLTGYLKENGGCLFQELTFAEERLNIKIT